jgi:sugar phosphate isomerase/epimerase
MFKNLDPSALGVSGHQSEIIELALTYGFRGLDLNVVEFAGRIKAQGVRYALRLLQSAKLRLGTFALPIEWDVDDDTFRREQEKLAELVQIAADAGCKRCICAVAPAGDNRPYHENFEFHKRRFAEICKTMEPAGVRLGVGFRATERLRTGRAFQFIHDLDALLLLLNMVGMPNVGLLVDVWDLWLAGGSVENLRALSTQQVVAVQLADLPADLPPAETTDEHRLVPGATGKIDCAAVLAALAATGYDGPVTVKADRSAFAGTRRDQIVRQAGEALDRVWKAAGLTPDGKLAPTAGK